MEAYICPDVSVTQSDFEIVHIYDGTNWKWKDVFSFTGHLDQKNHQPTAQYALYWGRHLLGFLTFFFFSQYVTLCLDVGYIMNEPCGI